MKSWKTTLGGSLTAAGAAMMGAGAMDWLREPEKYWFMLAGFGLTILGPIVTGLCATDLAHTKSVERDVKEVKASTDFMRKGAVGLAICSALVFAPGCGTLAKDGVYKGDKILYDADMALATSYDLLHNFVKWEYDHRATLASQPDIKRFADEVRSRAPGYFASAVQLRDAYRARPDAGTRDALRQCLDYLRSLTVGATKHLATAKTDS